MHTLFTTKECNRVLYLSPLSLPVVVVFTTVRNTFRHLLRVSRGQSLFRRRKAIEVSLDDVFFLLPLSVSPCSSFTRHHLPSCFCLQFYFYYFFPNCLSLVFCCIRWDVLFFLRVRDALVWRSLTGLEWAYCFKKCIQTEIFNFFSSFLRLIGHET